METGRQYVSAVGEAVAALQDAHDAVITKHVADKLVAASTTTLESIATMEANHKALIASLNSRIASYEGTIAQLVANSIEGVKEATGRAYADDDKNAVTALVAKFVGIGLSGLQRHAHSSSRRASVRRRIATTTATEGEGDDAGNQEEKEEDDENKPQAMDNGLNRSVEGSEKDDNEEEEEGEEAFEDDNGMLAPSAPMSPLMSNDGGEKNDETNDSDECAAVNVVEGISSISDWFLKVTAESKSTINSLSTALASVTAEREQFRSEIAVLKASSVPMADLTAAQQRIVEMEALLTVEKNAAVEKAHEMTTNATKMAAAFEADKKKLTDQTEQLNSQIAAMQKEIDAFKRQQGGAAVHQTSLNEALAECERSALRAAEAEAKLESFPQLQHQLATAKKAIDAFEVDRKNSTEAFDAMKKELNATLYQNAVLTQQLAEALSTVGKLTATQVAHIAVADAKAATALPSSASSSAAVAAIDFCNNGGGYPSRKWLFLSAGRSSATSNVTAIGDVVKTRASSAGIGLKVRRGEDEEGNTKKAFDCVSARFDGRDAAGNAIRSMMPTQNANLTDVIVSSSESHNGQLSAAAASIVASAVPRYVKRAATSSTANCCFGGAAVGLSDNSDREGSNDDTAAIAAASINNSTVAIHLAGYSVADVASLIQQNSLLVALLFEQRGHFDAIASDFKSLLSTPMNCNTNTTKDFLKSLPEGSALRKWALHCRDEANTSASSAKRLRVEPSLIVSFESDLYKAVQSRKDKLLLLLSNNAGSEYDDTCTTNDADGAFDYDAIINGASPSAAGGIAASLQSFADIKRELGKLLALGSGVAYPTVGGGGGGADNDDGFNHDGDAAHSNAEDEEDNLIAAGYTRIDDLRLAKNGKVYVTAGTSPDYSLLAAEDIVRGKERAVHELKMVAVQQNNAANAVTGVTSMLKRRADALSEASVTLTTAWAQMFASHASYESSSALDNDNNASEFKSVTTVTIEALRDSVASYATICTALDCEVSVLRAKMDAYEQQIVSLEDAVAVSTANDVSNFNALQMMGDYLLQMLHKVTRKDDDGSKDQSSSTARGSDASSGFGAANNNQISAIVANDPNTIAIMTTFANVVEVINATMVREETLADIFTRTCAAFRSNPALQHCLDSMKVGANAPQSSSSSGDGVSNTAAAADPNTVVARTLTSDAANNAIPSICTTETQRTCTFSNWKAFTSGNATTLAAIDPIVAAELRAALEAEKERADYFQDLFEQSAAQREEWIEHLFTTDQKCKDAEAQLAETQSTMVSTDEHIRVLLELESTLARKRTAEDLIEALQTSVNSRDADIAKLIAKIQQTEEQMMKNDSDHRAYEQNITAKLTALNRQLADRDGIISQIKSVLVQTQTQVTVEKTTIATLNAKVAELEAALNTMRHDTIEEAYRSGILTQMFPQCEEAVSIALEAAENKRLEAHGRMVEMEALYAKLHRTELDLQQSEAARLSESARRQRLELLLSDSEATVRSYYANVEEAMSALKVKCEALERSLNSVTRERDAALTREEALQSQLEVLGSDPTTENVRRYGLAATRLFEAQMTELHERFVATQSELGETQNALNETRADRDARVAQLTAEKAAYATALEKQHAIVNKIADEKDALATEHNALQNKHQQLAFDSTNQLALIQKLKDSEAALAKLAAEAKAAVASLKADNTSLLGVTDELKTTNGKLQKQVEITTRINDQLKQSAEEMKLKLQQQSSMAASANVANMSRGRPQHRFLQTRPN